MIALPDIGALSECAAELLRLSDLLEGKLSLILVPEFSRDREIVRFQMNEFVRLLRPAVVVLAAGFPAVEIVQAGPDTKGILRRAHFADIDALARKMLETIED